MSQSKQKGHPCVFKGKSLKMVNRQYRRSWGYKLWLEDTHGHVLAVRQN